MAQLTRFENVHVANRLSIDSLSLQQGQLTVVIGPNGAGKSTLLGELSKQLVDRFGATQTAWLEQQSSPAWPIAIKDLVALGRLPHNDRDSDAIDDALSAMELLELQDKSFNEASGGQQARALIGRCIATKPTWLLLDEPLSALDPKHQLKLISLLSSLVKTDQVSVVITMHSLQMAFDHADQIIVLDEGRVCAQALPSEIIESNVIEQVFGVRFTQTAPSIELAGKR